MIPHLIKVTFVTITSVLFFSAIGFSDDLPIGGASSWRPRQVAKDELKDSRGPVEDKLRTDVLGAFDDQERLARVRKILNDKWNVTAVDGLAKILIQGARPNPDGELSVHGAQWRAITNMLAYVSPSQGGKISACVQTLFDQLFESALVLDASGKYKENFFGDTSDAVADYGTADLLTESFWKGIQQGRWQGRVFEVSRRLQTSWCSKG